MCTNSFLNRSLSFYVQQVVKGCRRNTIIKNKQELGGGGRGQVEQRICNLHRSGMTPEADARIIIKLLYNAEEISAPLVKEATAVCCRW